MLTLMTYPNDNLDKKYAILYQALYKIFYESL